MNFAKMKKIYIILLILAINISCFHTYKVSDNEIKKFDAPLTKAGTKPWSKGKLNADAR